MFETVHFRGWAVWLVDHDKPWGHWRGRRREHIIRVRVGRWDLELHTPGRSPRELTGCPVSSLDWVLDEFDGSFNDLAVASLTYHLNYSIADNEAHRAVFEDLIARLSEQPPEPTPQESAAIDTWDVLGGEQLPDGCRRVPPCTSEASAAFDTWGQRQDAHAARITQARHDFVDIMTHLWS